MKKRTLRPRSGFIAAVDIGSTKVCCFIATVEDGAPRVAGIGHQVSKGVRNGVIIDIDAASQSVLQAVHAAEEMAGTTLSEVVINVSGGFGASRLVKAELALNGREVNDALMHKVLDQGHRIKELPDRTLIHSIPVGFSIDGGRSLRDPRGLFGQKLAVNMNIVTAALSTIRNLSNCIGRCHLETAAVVVSPYASGLSCLVDDESELGATVIDMGGGTTTIGVFFDGNLVFADGIPVGGSHVTNDIARGLSTPVVHAERMKTLYGSAITSSADEREMITVPLVGEDEDGHANHVSKSILVGIIAPRLEETFELVRDRLESSGFDKITGRRVVLTGGASQLPGTRELAGLILDKQVRVGRPLRIDGLAESTQGPAFATAAGLVHFALSERAEIPRRGRALTEQPTGLIGRLGNWVRDYL
jgi:cell division protein FtsA